MKQLYMWLIAMIQKLLKKGGLPAKKEESNEMPLKLDLQFFASDGDDDPGEDDGDDSEDDDQDDDQDDEDEDVPDLDELLKDPAFKKQYNARFKEQLAKRMKRHNKELERLKGNKKQDKGDDEGDDEETRNNEKRLLRAERREKRAIVKEFAVDNGHNPRLLARLIDLDEIELDDDGEPLNLDELFEELEEEFPEYFGPDKDDDEDDEEEERPRKKRFTPGARQKMNKKKKVDPREAGRQKALERHKKKEEN